MKKLLISCLALGFAFAISGTVAFGDGVPEYVNLQYGPYPPGNLLDLYLPDVPGNTDLPLIIWHSGSAWYSNNAKGGGAAIAEEFTDRGYAVASINIRSSFDARFPAQGYDVRAAIRWLREHAAEYGINPNRFAFMGNSSGGWAAAFAATTSDIWELEGETGVQTSSAVQVAVPFFPPTDFLSMDAFALKHELPQGFAYPHDSPFSPEGLLIECPGENFGDFSTLVSFQECPDETEAADPSSYIDGEEIPIWVLHGGEDPLLPYNQSQLVYEATTAEGNEARFTFVPSAVHDVNTIIDASYYKVYWTDAEGNERVRKAPRGPAPTWDNIERFINDAFNRYKDEDEQGDGNEQ